MLRLESSARRINKWLYRLPARKSLSTVSTSILNSLPTHRSTDSLWPELRKFVKNEPRRIVCLDDDPTGCQTVYDVNVLLDYSVDSIKRQLRADDKLFYILTNTRSLSENDAIVRTREIMANINSAVEQLKYYHEIQYISRSDSTLRGHFPAEVDEMRKQRGMMHRGNFMSDDGIIFFPAFFEGGRLTFNDVHYVKDGINLVPAGETPFAKDAHFGFKSSNLQEWIREKCGADREVNIVSISLHDIREGGPDKVAEILDNLPLDPIVIVNAVDQHDLNTFMLGLLQVEANGASFIYRTAASFVSARAALEPRGLLTAAQMQSSSQQTTATGCRLGGLVVCGSYVPKTSAQLDSLINHTQVRPVLLDVEALLKLRGLQQPQQLEAFISGMAQALEDAILQGTDVVLLTSRKFVEGAQLSDTAFVSETLREIVRRVQPQPAFLIAKGGITSHDVAQYSLGVCAARVLGQVEPGVPVWRCGHESRFPGLPYVVFPGNVGDNDALTRVAVSLGVKMRTDLSGGGGDDDAQQQQQQVAHSATVQVSSTQQLQKQERREGKSTTHRFEAGGSPWEPSRSGIISALRAARSRQTAVAAFNVYNLEGAKAAVAAAETRASPVILQVHPSSLQFGGRPLLSMLCAFRDCARVPVFVHLDHSTEQHERDVELALACGVDSVMVDGSAMPLEQNIRWTAKMAAWAHGEGVAVEAELGRLVGEEDGLSVSEKESKMTDPAQAALFVKETKIDMLAVTIGNVHGKYARPPQLDFARLEAIRSSVAAPHAHNIRSFSISSSSSSSNNTSTDTITDLPLVLHGASGLSSQLIQAAILRGGICKFNVNTDLRQAAMSCLRAQLLESNSKVDVLQLMQRTTEAMERVALDKIDLFNGLRER